jgi:hypothetical protein
MENDEKPKYQDIISFEQEGVKIIRDEKLKELFYDEGLAPIIWALRDKPLTVKEILEKYKEYVTISATKLGLKGKEREVKIEELERSEKTIYRYLKDLENAGLITKAGQRVVIGKTATENLFARTARIFLLEDVKKGWWEAEDSKLILNRVTRIIGIDTGEEAPDPECLASLMNEIEDIKSGEIFRLLREHEDEISKIILEGSFKENDRLLGAISTIALLKNADKYSKKVKECIG